MHREEYRNIQSRRDRPPIDPSSKGLLLRYRACSSQVRPSLQKGTCRITILTGMTFSTPSCLTYRCHPRRCNTTIFDSPMPRATRAPTRLQYRVQETVTSDTRCADKVTPSPRRSFPRATSRRFSPTGSLAVRTGIPQRAISEPGLGRVKQACAWGTGWRLSK